MNLIERLTEHEKNAMETYIDDYASEYGVRQASIDYILREWNTTKEDLFKMMGENFILEKPIVFKKGADELSEELYKKFGSYRYDCGNLDEGQCFLKAYEDIFISSLRGNSDWLTINRLEGLIDFYNLATNIYDGETFEVTPAGSEKAIKIQRGCKITRVLGKIAQICNLPDFEKFRIAHSQVLNQKMLKGRLCLSIHPLDYMTMSDNDCGWSSCMSWQDQGCYRHGTVEMMNSPYVVMAYLRSDEDMDLGHFLWSNKKWRELYIVTPKMIGNIKSYPYNNDNLTTEVLKWLRELADSESFSEEIIEYIPFEGFDYNNTVISIHPRTNHMYNDFNHSRSQYAYFAKDLREYYTFNYSGKSECMLCGELNPYLPIDESLAGECCERNSYCDCCGDRYDPDDLTEIDGEYLCSYCVENECGYDSITGELHLCSNLTPIYFGDNKSYCCYGALYIDNFTCGNTNLKKYFKRVRMVTRWYTRDFYVTIEDLTEEGKKLFYDIEFLQHCLNNYDERSNVIELENNSEDIENCQDWYHFTTPVREDITIQRIYNFD